MAVSLRDLLSTPALELRVLAGEDRLDRPVSWVAVSEHEDPTPWLDGGELVLSTGVRLSPRPGARDLGTYVERLLAADVAALGFGVGVVHAHCPRGLVSACAASGLPLVEVPRPTPFIAIGKELSRLIDAERAARLTQRLHRMRRLSAAAGAGADALVQRLAGYLGGWCLLMDADAMVVAGHPRGAENRLGDAAEGVRRVRTGGLAASASLSAAGERIDVLPLGVAGRLSGLLVCGAAGGEAEDQGLVAYAASLLSLGHGRAAELEAAHHDARTLALTVALGGGDVPTPVSVPWDRSPVRVAALAADLDTVRVCLEPLPESAWAATQAPGQTGGTVAVWQDGVHELALSALAGTAGGVSAVVGGEGAGPPGPALTEALREAVRRHHVARGRLLVADDGSAASVFDLVEPDVLSAWAAELLRPLTERPDGPGLVAALRASLAHPASTEKAASAAGVHRHTLRRRLRLVDDLLAGDLDDPTRRAEILLALTVA